MHFEIPKHINLSSETLSRIHAGTDTSAEPAWHDKLPELTDPELSQVLKEQLESGKFNTLPIKIHQRLGYQAIVLNGEMARIGIPNGVSGLRTIINGVETIIVTAKTFQDSKLEVPDNVSDVEAKTYKELRAKQKNGYHLSKAEVKTFRDISKRKELYQDYEWKNRQANSVIKHEWLHTQFHFRQALEAEIGINLADSAYFFEELIPLTFSRTSTEHPKIGILYAIIDVLTDGEFSNWTTDILAERNYIGFCNNLIEKFGEEIFLDLLKFQGDYESIGLDKDKRLSTGLEELLSIITKLKSKVPHVSINLEDKESASIRRINFLAPFIGGVDRIFPNKDKD